ncbi:hypothetical protein G6011_06499 [Alternaria panax]|uniref:Arrestin-like N-terminal domain-containing protein n=1 Tax=Alternaria panax TaxID=48097 RepID=A0AAD4FJC6_9PLEO|nr:hypothetical protein G6011_06499 [Alternaria panax]
MALAASTTGSRANRRDNSVYIEVLTPPPFYTSGDCILGKLLVEPASRPSRIRISLKGFSLLEDVYNRSVRVDFYGSSQDLYTSTGDDFQRLTRNTTDPTKVDLPFSFEVPQHATIHPPAERLWVHPMDSYNHPRFQHSPGFPLPPSLSGPTPTSPQVLYHLEAYMESEVPKREPLKIRQEIKYMPPAPHFHPALLQPDLNFGNKLPKHCSRQKLIRSRQLFPDYSERQGKLGRFKDKLVDKELLFGLQSFAEIPYVQFNLFATPASVLVLGSMVPVIVTVQHLKRSESLPLPPDLFLKRLKVQLNATTNMFVPGEQSGRHAIKANNTSDKKNIVLCDEKFEKEQELALYDGLNLLDVANIEIPKDIIPSFTTYGLNLEYELQIEISGRCADREWTGIACTQPVQVVTGWQKTPNQATNPFEAGPEPEYQELDPMAQLYEIDSNRTASELGIDAPAYELNSRHMAPHMADSVPPPEYTVSH